jgi:hypothetical protein
MGRQPVREAFSLVVECCVLHALWWCGGVLPHMLRHAEWPGRPGSSPLPGSLGSCAIQRGLSALHVPSVQCRPHISPVRPQASEDDSSVPARWAQEHPGQERVFSQATMPFLRCDVPQQDNHCDCGLFVLSHIEFFIHGALAMEELQGAPLAINFKKVGA